MNGNIQIVKTQIAAKTRKLAATWTVQPVVETEIMEILSGEIQKELSGEIQKEINWEVLCEVDPSRKHWIELKFSKTARAAGNAAVEAWCKETFVDRGYFVFTDRVMFDRAEDAEFFMLRWV